MTQPQTPNLDEFISLDRRRSAARRAHGFGAMRESCTVAIYSTRTAGNYQILTVRFSEEAAERYRLVEGARLACHIHPDQQHLALRVTTDKRKGARLFKPHGSRALVFQTSLREGMMPPQKATVAAISEVDGALVVSMNP